MNITTRMRNLFRIKTNRALDHFDDPRESLDDSYDRQVDLLAQLRRGLADVTTARKRIELQGQELGARYDRLGDQAQEAMDQGREDLARIALERKSALQAELQSLDTQVQELESQQEKLIENEKKMRQKIEAFRTKKEVIKAQYSASEAQVRISEAASGVGEQMADLGLAMQRAEEKTENMRARANAMDELEAAGAFDDALSLGSGQDDIDKELAQLSSGAEVEDELAKMKAELGPGSGSEAQGALEQGKGDQA